MKISYTDGAEVESRIVQLLAKGKDMSSSSLLASEHYDNWAVRYHLCPERSNLFRHLDFDGLDVLELGAGMGGASRFPAENARSFTAVEGTEARMDALRQRLRDLRNWNGVVSDIQEFKTDKRFDVVCIIGVLEYAEIYMNPDDGESPFGAMFKKAVSLLKPGGVVAVAIENSLGIKYWSGSPEDHTGRLYDGICGYPESVSPRTFSRARLRQFFESAGLSYIEEFFPWPDYKTPHAILSKKFVDRFPNLAADIAVDAVAREEERSAQFPLSLALPGVVSSGLLADFSNSFLFVGGREPNSFVQSRLFRRMRAEHEVAWHYSIRRKRPIRTVFRLDPMYRRAPYVDKQPLHGENSKLQKDAHSDYVQWRQQAAEPALLEPKVSHFLRSTAYFQGRAALSDAMAHFVKWSFKRFRFEEGYLRPAAFDAVPQNAVITQNGYQFFDLEWDLVAPMNQSWFILRTTFTMRDVASLLPAHEAASPADLYHALCERLGVAPQLEDDIRRESTIQADVFRRVSAETAFEAISAMMNRKSPPMPRDPSEEATMRLNSNSETGQAVLRLQASNDHLERQMSRNCVKIALSVDSRLRRFQGLYGALRKGYKFGSRLRKRR